MEGFDLEALDSIKHDLVTKLEKLTDKLAQKRRELMLLEYDELCLKEAIKAIELAENTTPPTPPQ